MLSLPVANSSLGLGEFDYGTQPIPHARISALSMEHDDLGLAIDALVGANTQDELMIARLKKRRLQIQDEIAGLVGAQMLGAPGAAILQADADVDASQPHAVGMKRPSTAESFVVSTFVAVLILFVVALGWSDLMDALNQMFAQIYVLSLLAAANG